jgi:hypothetical protein
VSLISAASSTSDPLNGLFSYGVLGIIFVLIMLGQLVPGNIYKKVEQENDRLRTLIEDRVLPALERSNDVIAKALELVERQARRGGGGDG